MEINKTKKYDIDEICEMIMDCEIPIPINKLFNKDGSHKNKKQYGITLIEFLCKELKKKYGEKI